MKAVDTDTHTLAHPTPVMDVKRIRNDFPLLSREVNGNPLVYLDNAATAQKPQTVLDALNNYYLQENSNVHRGVHTLSQTATDHFEQVREKMRSHINAKSTAEIIFTRGTTEGINLVAYAYGNHFIHAGDEIIITTLEHHSNIVPWQMLCERKGAILKIVPVDDSGTLDIEAYKKLLSAKTKLVAVAHISNTLGTINPVADMVAMAHSHGAVVLVDGAQAAPHMQVDVQQLDCDFYTVSGHKLFGPTGTGILYGKEDLLNSMPPFHGGGEMIDNVTFEKTTYNELPFKFEAGTPHIAGVVGLGAALDYVNQIGYEKINAYEHQLLVYATEKLSTLPGIRFIGTAEYKAAVVSFLIGNIHPYDTGVILDKLGIAVRTGHHCTQPLMDRYKIPGTVRASFAFYNTFDEIDTLHDGLLQVIKMLGR